MRFLTLAALAAITTAFFTMPSQAQKESSATGGLDSLLSDFWRVWDHESPHAALISIADNYDATHKEQAQGAVDRITEVLSRGGKNYGRDEVSRVVVGSRLVKVRYLLRFENGPVVLDLTYYRPDTAWRWLSFNETTDLVKIIPEAAPTTQSDSSQKLANGGE